MRIKDKIANEIINYLEENVEGLFELKQEEFLDIECGIADLIEKRLAHWLNWDVDLNEIKK